jgi:predicted secreted hydrolase
MSKIKLEDISTKDDTLVVHLPDPELCSYRIDHSKSKIYDTKFIFLDEKTMITEAYIRAETKIKESALSMGILEQTKKNAELVLKPLLENVSGKKVVLQYKLKATLNGLK